MIYDTTRVYFVDFDGSGGGQTVCACGECINKLNLSKAPSAGDTVEITESLGECEYCGKWDAHRAPLPLSCSDCGASLTDDEASAATFVDAMQTKLETCCNACLRSAAEGRNYVLRAAACVGGDFNL